MLLFENIFNDRYDFSNFLGSDGYPNDDLIDQCLRVVDFNNYEESNYDEIYDRSYERWARKLDSRKEAICKATRSALLTVIGEPDNFRQMVEAYMLSKGPDDIPEAIKFANLPEKESDDRTPDEKWEDYVTSR